MKKVELTDEECSMINSALENWHDGICHDQRWQEGEDTEYMREYSRDVELIESIFKKI